MAFAAGAASSLPPAAASPAASASAVAVGLGGELGIDDNLVLDRARDRRVFGGEFVVQRVELGFILRFAATGGQQQRRTKHRRNQIFPAAHHR
jgi:hypothetical protein